MRSLSWQLLRQSYTAQRLAVALLALATALTAAWILGPQLYGQLAVMAFIGKILLVGNGGAASGYIHRYYDQQLSEMDSRSYVLTYVSHLALIAFVAYWVGHWADEIYALGALCFALLIPYYAVEPVLRVRRHFLASLLPEAATSIAISIGLLIVVMTKKPNLHSTDFLHLVLILMACSLVPFLLWFRRYWRAMARDDGHISFSRYLSTVRAGLPLYAGTASFLVLLSVDRLFLERLYPSEILGTYMLAFQLATGAALLLTSRNFVASITFGEMIRDNKPLARTIAQGLMESSLIGALSFVLLVTAAKILETFVLHSYTGLTSTAAALGFGLCLFHLAGNLTPIAFFRRRQLPLTLGIVCLVFLSILHNTVVFTFALPSKWISIMTGLWLSIYAIFAIRHAMRVSQHASGS